MEKKTLVKPQIDEYDNFEVYGNEGDADAWTKAGVIGTWACVAVGIAALFSSCT